MMMIALFPPNSQGTAKSSADCSTNGFTHSRASGRANGRNAAIGVIFSPMLA